MPDPYPFPSSGTAGGAPRAAEAPAEGASVLETAQNAASAVADRAKDVAASVAEQAQQAASSVADTTRHLACEARDAAEEAWESTSEYASDRFADLTRWVQRNPRTALALGFAIGCGLGYCLVALRERY